MKRILVILEAGSFADRVVSDLNRDYEVTLCHSYEDAENRLTPMPDAMILQMQLPGNDGLAFLEQMRVRPAVLLAVSSVFPPYTSQKLYDLGVGHLIRTPCSASAVSERIRDMIGTESHDHQDPQARASRHLTVLGFTPTEGGGKHLRIGLPLFAQDHRQKLSCELYPTIGKFCNTTATDIESKIRHSIKAAWTNRDPEVWEEYFPGISRCPTNKYFISTLAKRLY